MEWAAKVPSSRPQPKGRISSHVRDRAESTDDSSLAEDRTLANEVYGPARIPIYWIVNLGDRQVEVYTDPAPAGYLSTEVFPDGQCVPVVIDAQQLGLIAVSDILPLQRTG